MIDLKDFKNKNIYFIGIGGCSMSGLAQILHSQGYHVSGSDAKESPFTKTLESLEIPVFIGHNEAHVKGADLVIYSAAIKPTNPEYAYAQVHDIPMLERSKLLGLISKNYETVIGVSGCHGKTTITSMLALITQHSHIDPTVHVGGMVDFLSGGVRVGNGNTFITEACEYVKSFLTLHPTHIIINNIDDDHLDFYKNITEIIAAFQEFIRLLPPDGKVFAYAKYENTKKALKAATVPIVTYGLEGTEDYSAVHVAFDSWGAPSFDVLYHGENLGRIQLHVPGSHNIINALAAIAVAHQVFGISIAECAPALADYHLVGRRFELMGEKDGVKMIHDYAHHPSEIAACLDAAKKYPHKKLWVLFQCNSYTRAKTLKEKYAKVFENADMVMVPDIYPGRDIDPGDIHATDLVQAINEHSHNCIYLATFGEIKEYLQARWQPGDLLVTLGSGDVYQKQMILLKD